MPKRILLLLFCLCSFCCASATPIKLPKLAPAGYNGLTLHEEKMLGKQFYAYMQVRANLVTDPLILDYINRLGFRLVAASQHSNQHFLFFVVKDDSINAFAGPYGYIGLNTGLILFTNTEGELASVLAHEIAHVTQRHIAQNMEAANKGVLPTAAAVIAGIITGNPALAIGAMGANAQSQLNFTRAHEREADHEGAKTLARAQFDPKDMARMFDHMRRANYDSIGQRIAFLRSHPLTENRIARAQNQTGFKQTKKYLSSLHFYLVQTRLAVDLSTDPKKTLRFFTKKLEKQPNNIVLQYGKALALANNLQIKPALGILMKLSKLSPDEIYFSLSLAELETTAGNYTTALKTLEAQQLLYPSYFPLIMQTSATLLQAKKYPTAIQFMKPHYSHYKNNLLFLNNYQRALGEAGRLAKSYEIRAKMYLLLQQKKPALQQLELATVLPGLDKYQKASILAQIKALTPENTK